jgi:hypothetical protein
LPTEPEEPDAPTEVLSGEEYPPGPLEEKGWEYVGYILREDPLDNQVFLKKKADAAVARPGAPRSSRSNVRTRTIIRPSTRTRTSGRLTRTAVRPKDRVTFLVGDRWFIDKELELDFMIHSVDEERFIYWIHGSPKDLYALKLKHESPYLGSPQEGLRPPPEATEEIGGAKEDPEEDKPKLIQIVPRDFQDRREMEYADMLGGGKPGPAFEAITSGSPSTGGETTPGAGDGSVPPAGKPRTPTAEEKRQLQEFGEIMRTAKMKPEDRAALRSTLQNIPKK